MQEVNVLKQALLREVARHYHAAKLGKCKRGTTVGWDDAFAAVMLAQQQHISALTAAIWVCTFQRRLLHVCCTNYSARSGYTVNSMCSRALILLVAMTGHLHISRLLAKEQDQRCRNLRPALHVIKSLPQGNCRLHTARMSELHIQVCAHVLQRCYAMR